MSTLEIRGLQVSVNTDAGAVEILKGVDLTIKSGETHAIMGPNGSGKSTLAYSIAGHPKYSITGGTVTLDGVDLLEMTVDERKLLIRYIKKTMLPPVQPPKINNLVFFK
jgi:Fe-S cluster assembly ATP-binding protein